MGHPTKKPRDQEALGGNLQPNLTSALPSALLEAGESDDEYEDIPARHPKGPAQAISAPVDATPAVVMDGETPALAPGDGPATEAPQVTAEATDDDWLRSRTSRLLDLVDPDDPAFAARAPPSMPSAAPASEPQQSTPDDPQAVVHGPGDVVPVQAENTKDAAKLVEKTSRLFLRNLSYKVTEDDVREHFSKFGSLEEVSITVFSLFPPPDGRLP
jgi:multiple RNA-binding domain-containing protein 1